MIRFHRFCAVVYASGLLLKGKLHLLFGVLQGSVGCRPYSLNV